VSRAAVAVGACVVAAVACGRREPAGRGPDLADVMIVGESTRLRTTDPIPNSSAFFDGTGVKLTLARGETIGLQVLYRGEREVLVDLASADLEIRRSVVEPVIVTRPTTAMWGPSRGRGEYPDRLRRLAPDDRTPTAGPVLIELAVARVAPPGLVRGTITVGGREISLEVTIAPVRLPPLGARPRVWAYYDTREVAAVVGAGDARAAEVACAAMLREHGVMATPELTLDSYDQRKAAVAGSPFVPILLGDAVEATVAGWIAKLAGTSQVAFTIPIDEPRAEADKRRVRALADRVRAAGGGPGKFLYAVTDQPHPIYGDAIDLYISPFAVTRDGDRSTPRWTYNGTPPWAGAMTVDAGGVDLRTWGWIAWRWKVPVWYVWDGLYWHDRHNRKRNGLDPMGGAANTGATDAVTFDDGEDHGNLDGALLLPPLPGATATGCTPTLRLATLRRGLEDRLLLDALEARGGRARADAIAAELGAVALGDAKRGAAAAWPADEAAWERARQRLIAELAGCMM
jgi:hypothetical protein